MTRNEREHLKELKEKSNEALDILIQIRNELEEMGRKRDTQKFVKLVDTLDEWLRD